MSDWHNDENVELKGELGRGGMGVVYRALDRRLDREVALKTLSSDDAGRLMALKREFRARAGMSHPNLVQLYELHTDGDQPWMTMELVEGEDLMAWVRGLDRVGAGASETWSEGGTLDRTTDGTLDRTADGTLDGTLDAPGARAEEGGVGPQGTARLRAAVGQLLHGLDALHGAGLVHRDVKPGNTRVTPEGRVVLLDFGLAMVAEGPGADSPERVGTVRYMAPEQAAGRTVGPAADLYAVGVILYEALTGRDPLPDATVREQLRWKQAGRPPHPGDVSPGCDPALAELAMALMEPDPAARPKAADALALLGEKAAPLVASALEPLVGRTAERAALADALDRARCGGRVVVHVHGPSGIGKSHLVTAALADAEARGALALIGRCHPDEVVAYKALDAAIDHLARVLRGLDRDAQDALRPDHADALVRLFPALRSVAALAVAGAPGGEEPALARRRGFEALRALLAGLAAPRPLVLWLDDVHWGDRDSAELVEALLEPDGGLAALIILTYRTEERDRSVFLRHLDVVGASDAALGLGGAHETVDLPLAALDPDAVRGVLAEHLPAARVTEALVDAALRQTGGNAFMVALLGRHLARGGEDVAGLDVDRLLAARLAALDPGERRLVEVAAVTVGPTGGELVLAAAAAPAGARVTLTRLADERLLRLVTEGDAVAVAPYHDRVRLAALDGLAADGRAGVSRSLAEVFEARRPDDAESLLVYWEGAGERGLAGGYAERAGDRAAEGLAFERAADLFTRALDLQGEAADRPSLLERLARAQAAQGLAPAAAGSFDAAADALAGEGEALRALALRSEAADQHLSAGYYRRGWRASKAVLEALSLPVPRSARSATLSSLWRRLRYLFFGFRAPDPKAGGDVTTRLRMEALLNTALAFAGIEATMADIFRLRALDVAVALGDAHALVTIYVFEATMLKHLDGALFQRRRREAAALAARYAASCEPDYGEVRLAQEQMIDGFVDGDWGRAVDAGERSLASLREGALRRHFIIATVNLYVLDSLAMGGRIRRLRERVAQLRPDWEARRDIRGLHACYEGYAALLWLAEDRPDLARRGPVVEPEDERPGATWPEDLFGKLNGRRPLALCAADLYEGYAWLAWRRFQSVLADLDQSFGGKLCAWRVFTRDLRSRVALAAAAAGPPPADMAAWTRERLLAVVAADCARIAGDPLRGAAPMAAVLAAGLAVARGEVPTPRLRAAVAGFEAAAMALHREVARLALADALGGEEGEAARAIALAWMREEGVVDPGRMRRVLTPGI